MVGRALLAVMVAALVACGAAVPQVPGRGGPPWTEVTSEHFTLWTDGDLNGAHELVREMERLRQVVVGVAFPTVPAAGRNLVIAFRDFDELRAFSYTDQPRAFTVPAQPPLWQPMIVLSADSLGDRGETTVAHELTHLISFAVIHHQPRWFAEGMAQFFETVRLDSASTTVDVGFGPKRGGRPVRLPRFIPIATLFAWKGMTAEEHPNYATAWALFTFLLNAHPAELVDYMRRLDADRGPGSAERVWNEAFPSLPLATIDDELQRWMTTGRHVVLHFKVERQSWPVVDRKLADADVYAIRGLLRGVIPSQKAQAHLDLTAAIAADPTTVIARVVMVVREHAAITPADARTLTAAHADDWRAWWLAATAASARDASSDRDAAASEACARIALNPALVAPPKLCTH